MSFNGQVGSQRKVALGGRRAAEPDRRQLLEKARLDRERRARARLEQAAATTIQRFARGLLARRRAAAQARREHAAQAGGNGCAGAQLRRLLVFADPVRVAGDVALLAAVAQRLVELGPGELCADGAPPAAVALRARRLAALLVAALHARAPDLAAELRAPAGSSPWPPLAAALAVLTAPDAGAWCGAEGREGVAGDPLGVLEHVARRGLFAMLRRITVLATAVPGGEGGASTAEPTVAEALAATLCGRAAAAGGAAAGGGAASLVAQVLTVPLLWRRSRPFAATATPLWEYGASALASLVHERVPLMPLMPRDGGAEGAFNPAACLLGNLLEVTPSALASAPPRAARAAGRAPAAQFAVAVEALLRLLPRGTFPGEDEDDEDDDAAAAAAACGDDLYADGNVREADGMVAEPLPPALSDQISLMYDGQLLSVLVREAIPPPDVTAATASAVGASPAPEQPTLMETATAAARLCSVLQMEMVRLPPAERGKLMWALAFTSGLVPRLWACLRRCHVEQTWPEGVRGEPGWLLPLAVFCPVLSCLLLTCDDEDFYDRGQPLPVADYPVLVGLLKVALLHLVWGAGSHAGTAPLGGGSARAGAVAGIQNLMAQLNTRNGRRQFIDPAAFTAPAELRLDSAPFADRFVAEALEEDTKAAELLRRGPSLVPFELRVRAFQALVRRDKEQAGRDPRLEVVGWGSRQVEVRRSHVFADAIEQLHNVPMSVLKGHVRIRFVDQFGEPEAGVDGGGLFKDFLSTLTREAFDSQYGLFKETEEHLLYPNPGSALAHEQHLSHFEFMGTILGKAMYEGILVELPFANFFLSKLRGRRNGLNDLPSLDAELYRSLLFLKRYEGDVQDLCLFFTVTDNSDFGDGREVELVPGGRNIPVTQANKLRYIDLVAHFRLNAQIRAQSAAFLRGFQQLIAPEWIGMFNEQELQVLISGTREGVDLADLRMNAQYSGGYTVDHPTIQLLWKAVATFKPEEQRAFLRFVTACSNAPLLGFSHLEPRFCVHRAGQADNGAVDLERLPTAATCMNLLKLPPYTTLESMREKVLYAISAGAGFDLS